MLVGTQTTKRAKLRLIVHNEPAQKPHLYQRYPIATGQTILAGQVISLHRNTTSNRIEWLRGFDAVNSLPNKLFIARQDGADGDVQACGTLPGLSSDGGFEISSAFFKTGETYVPGDEITFDGVTGNFRKVPTTPGSYVVFARVSKDFSSPVDFGSTYTPAAATATQSAGVTGGSFVLARRTNANDLRLVRMTLVPIYTKVVPVP